MYNTESGAVWCNRTLGEDAAMPEYLRVYVFRTDAQPSPLINQTPVKQPAVLLINRRSGCKVRDLVKQPERLA